MSNFRNKRLSWELSVLMKHLRWYYEPQFFSDGEWHCAFYDENGNNRRYDSQEEAENVLRPFHFNDNVQYRVRPIFA